MYGLNCRKVVQAMTRPKWILADAVYLAAQTHKSNPSTDIDKLVNDLWEAMEYENREESEVMSL